MLLALKCPYCNHPETKVLDSRDAEELELTRRRRECEKCGRRFTTYERVEMLDLFIIKKDKRREPFSEEKLRNGVLAACQKRPIPRSEVEKLVEQVKLTLKGKDSNEIPSSEVGELVMAGLKKLDKVAYVRFASIHKEFEDLSEFKKEIREAEKG